jgi:hypothetical protein
MFSELASVIVTVVVADASWWCGGCPQGARRWRSPSRPLKSQMSNVKVDLDVVLPQKWA